jgi:pimeloyl-ACP methyl ester carboxylesterase
LCAALNVTYADSGSTGFREDVQFSDYSPLSTNSELLRRVTSPLTGAQVQASLRRSSQHLIEQSIDLAAEKFVLYVPPAAPPHGYGVLVFVPPWQEARLPEGWSTVLDHYGVIYVSAARSGNEENVVGRREPLAVLEAHNVILRYPVDPTRVYVGGFSGGARIALRLALAFPDLFNGVLLNAGSDPLGTLLPPLPPEPLWRRFQESTRLVYLTGERDTVHLGMDGESLHSMHQWCVFNTDSQIIPGAAHELARPAALSAALQALLAPPARNSKLPACQADIEGELSAQLQKVQSLIAHGDAGAAQKLLLEVDRRFGGLAAPRSLELQALLNPAGAEGAGQPPAAPQ